ncbi:MAG: hydrogenase maturation protease [Chloroflexi bacterium]|nr:hydrogenase maturation protease [Chloroflexota bacterium]
MVSIEVLLIGGVGYTYLGDLSFGPTLVERLRTRDWPSSVAIEDVSYNPITVMDWLRDDPQRFHRAVFVTAVARGREPGSLHRSHWRPAGPSADQVQDSVAAAVTGTISLENLLIIGSHFELLPAETEVIEIEPVTSGWGEGLSAVAERRVSEVTAWLSAEIESGSESVARPASTMS